MKRRWTVWSAVILSAGLAAGCATTRAMESAQASYDKAKASSASTKAPFEFYAAEAYLAQAKHEVAEGDGKAARDFAKQSEFYSAKAMETAGGGAK